MLRAATTFVLTVAATASVTLSATEAPTFAKDIEPLLRRHCFRCHGGSARMGGLDLRSPAAMIRGGAQGPSIQKGSSAASLLYKRIVDQSMPMGPAKVPLAGTRAIAAWIDAGAPGDVEAAPAGGREQQRHWAFRPLTAPPIPSVQDATWVRTSVDAFVLRALEDRGIRPAPPASPRTLMRRLSLTITGLPPTDWKTSTFLQNPSHAAADTLVKDLLARPQYGERWARHWLDVARYAESNGYERDGTKPSAWRYRDWTIDAFNGNKRFDRFIAEQMAGDELEDADAGTQIATTFLRLGVWDDEPADERMDRYDQLDDVLAATSTAFLGITLRCARCHDHKFEPLTQRDYYKTLALFEPLQRPVKSRAELDREVGTPAELSAYREAMRQAEAGMDPLRKLIANLKRGLLERVQSDLAGTVDWREDFATVLAVRVAPDRRTPAEAKLADAFEKKLEDRMLALARPDEREQLASWQRRLQAIERGKPKPPLRAYVWHEDPAAPTPATYMLHRGDPTQPRDVVQPGVPAIIAGDFTFQPGKTAAGTSGRRLWLARWLTGPAAHLTARVFVNRVWQWHFGEGLVSTANDFGVMGQRPSHPELLDHLASEFIRSGWNVKELQRLILESNTFRVSSEWDAARAKLDPEQTLLWRWKPRRLEAEAVRDSMLLAAGTLNPAMHGPSIYPELPRPVLAQQSRPGDGWGKSAESEASRRSIYIFAKRGLPVPEMDLLDAPDTTVSCERRRVSVTGTQALTLLNGAFTQRQAGQLAARARASGAAGGANVQAGAVFELALGRPPSPRERDDALRFLAAPGGTLEQLCLVLLNSNEFFYLN